MADGSPESVVEHLSDGIGGYLRRQPGKQTSEGLRAVALQGENVLELVYDALDELPLSRRPLPGLLRPRPPGALLRSGGNPGAHTSSRIGAYARPWAGHEASLKTSAATASSKYAAAGPIVYSRARRWVTMAPT